MLRKFGELGGMFSPGVIALLLLAALCPAYAAATEPGSSCLDAATAAERAWTLPPDLIGAIGRVESGRIDRATSRLIPWPWTVNADGHGSYFDSLAEAVGYVRALQSRGVRIIDVGCFQIDLFYHPAAFASLEQAFDPAANANYAARFLTVLRSQTGSWPAAIAGYHSGATMEGTAYRLKVLNQWGWGATLAGVSRQSPARHVLGGQPDRDQFVVLMSATARTVHIIGP